MIAIPDELDTEVFGYRVDYRDPPAATRQKLFLAARGSVQGCERLANAARHRARRGENSLTTMGLQRRRNKRNGLGGALAVVTP